MVALYPFIPPIAFSYRCVGGQLHSNQSALLLFCVIVLSSCCQPLLIEDRVIILLSVIRHASGPQESQEQTMACTPPPHRSFHSGGSLASWDERRGFSSVSVIAPATHACRRTGSGLSPPAASVPETPNVGFGRGVGVINVCSSINGQPGPTQALSPTISKQGLPNIKRQIFYIKYYFNHI